MARKHPAKGLGARERQILDVIYQLGEASVAEVLANLPDPPSYSAVRTMIRLLEKKGMVTHRRNGMKYVYQATQSRESAARLALDHLMQTFFGGSASDTVAAILDVSSSKLNDDELRRLEELIEQARQEGK